MTQVRELPESIVNAMRLVPEKRALCVSTYGKLLMVMQTTHKIREITEPMIEAIKEGTHVCFHCKAFLKDGCGHDDYCIVNYCKKCGAEPYDDTLTIHKPCCPDWNGCRECMRSYDHQFYKQPHWADCMCYVAPATNRNIPVMEDWSDDDDFEIV